MDFMLTRAQKQRFVSEFRHRLENAEALPILPEVAGELLKLRNNPNAGIPELIDVVKQDPSSAAQLMRYARLSIFGYGDRIKTLDDAVQMVLGFDKALCMVLGWAAGKPLRMEANGPLGRKALWRHGVYIATLCQALAAEMPAKSRPSLGLAYLTGLMHDIGFMLVGHLYPHEFSLLNEVVAKYSEIEIRELELITLGVSHDMTGMWLMRAWNMPEEVVVGVGEHYFPDYDGKHCIFPKLVHMADNVLALYDSKGASALSEGYAPLGLDRLQISEESFDKVVEQVFGISSELNGMAEQLAA